MRHPRKRIHGGVKESGPCQEIEEQPMSRFKKIFLLIAAAAAVSLSAAACGSDSQPATSTNPYDSIPNYGNAIEKAQDAAAQAEKRAKEVEDAVREAEGSQ